jgi:hypothetical protein
MNATELANWLDDETRNYRSAEWDQCIAELRRIPKLERMAWRAPDADEREVIEQVINALTTSGYYGLANKLSSYLTRIAPKPLLTWSDHGNGVWTAQHNGATYLIAPDHGSPAALSIWPARGHGIGLHDDVEAAKATAEKWARGE